MTNPTLSATGGYDALYQGFRWNLPARLNMARQACFDWAESAPERIAILDLSGPVAQPVSYGDLADMVRSLAAHLQDRGVGQGDRVGVLRSQDAWCAAAHLAAWTLGAISVPLFKLFGPDALSVRLQDSGARLVLADAEGAARLANVPGAPAVLVPETLATRPGPDPIETGPDTPAIIIYTSGTTGAPKGALHGHRLLTGHLPGVEMSHDRLGQPGDVIWTPADWAWIGGLFDVLMPGLALGVPVVAARLPKFTPDACVDIVARGQVRNVFFPPTALKMLKAADRALPGLRSVASGGEPLGAEMLAWGQRAFGLSINEFYGQTECNMIASSAASLFPARPGCIGKAVPGHALAVLGPEGLLGDGVEGDIAVKRGSASMLLEYWHKPEATAQKFRTLDGIDWMLTGDRGFWQDGYLRFVGRDDDVITSAGYRIGPTEIEDCLMRHPAVALAAVIGVPDPLRTEAVQAHVVLRDGVSVTEAALQDHVRTRLSAHLVPRRVVFETALPMTVTGKIMRRTLRDQASGKGGVA